MFERINELPKPCTNTISEEESKDPIYNFEVFASTVEEHYAFMELNSINWERLYNEKLETLKKNPTEITLYYIIEEMLEELNDNHGYFEATDELYALMEEQSQATETDDSNEDEDEEEPEIGDLEVAGKVAKNHLIEEFTKDSWQMQWGKLTDSIGYVQIKTMWLYADLKIPKELIEEKGYFDAYVETFSQMYEGDYIEMEVESVKKTMDNVIKDLSDMKSIVLDVRFNGGGQDAVSFEILRRFTSKRLHIVNQRLKTADGFSPELKLYIEGDSDAFTKPVYVLTSQQTGSAAEAFSIATLKIPNIKRIGSNTSGAMSTALEKHLPNGWFFSISNEVYMDTNNNLYENKGIPVDYQISYPEDRQTFFRFILENLDKDKDQILKAIDKLNAN